MNFGVNPKFIDLSYFTKLGKFAETLFILFLQKLNKELNFYFFKTRNLNNWKCSGNRKVWFFFKKRNMFLMDFYFFIKPTLCCNFLAWENSFDSFVTESDDSKFNNIPCSSSRIPFLYISTVLDNKINKTSSSFVMSLSTKSHYFLCQSTKNHRKRGVD